MKEPDEFSNVKFSLSNYDSKTIISQIIDEKISFGFIAVNPNNNQIKSIKIKPCHNDYSLLISLYGILEFTDFKSHSYNFRMSSLSLI